MALSYYFEEFDVLADFSSSHFTTVKKNRPNRKQIKYKVHSDTLPSVIYYCRAKLIRAPSVRELLNYGPLLILLKSMFLSFGLDLLLKSPDLTPMFTRYFTIGLYIVCRISLCRYKVPMIFIKISTSPCRCFASDCQRLYCKIKGQTLGKMLLSFSSFISVSRPWKYLFQKQLYRQLISSHYHRQMEPIYNLNSKMQKLQISQSFLNIKAYCLKHHNIKMHMIPREEPNIQKWQKKKISPITSGQLSHTCEISDLFKKSNLQEISEIQNFKTLNTANLRILIMKKRFLSDLADLAQIHQDFCLRQVAIITVQISQKLFIPFSLCIFFKCFIFERFLLPLRGAVLFQNFALSQDFTLSQHLTLFQHLTLSQGITLSQDFTLSQDSEFPVFKFGKWIYDKLACCNFLVFRKSLTLFTLYIPSQKCQNIQIPIFWDYSLAIHLFLVILRFLLVFFLVMQRKKVFRFTYVSAIKIFRIILTFFMILHDFDRSICMFLNSE